MLNIENKVDSPEKQAAVSGKPTENYLFATEFNQVVQAINTLAENSTFSEFTTYLPPVVVTGQFTAPANQAWKINAVNYTNPSIVNIPVPLSAIALKRFDEFYATTENTFVRVPGLESTNPEYPRENPEHGLRYSVLLVTDSVFGVPSEPVSGSTYKVKNENADSIYSLGAFEYISAGEASYCRIETQTTGLLKAISVMPGNNFAYPGKEYTIKNETGAPMTLKHLDTTLTGSNYKKLWFSNSTDFVLQNGESAKFIYSSGRFEFKSTSKSFIDWVISLFVPKSRTITINGTTQDLSADRSFTVGSGDMTTNTDQTVSGIKTFLNGKFGLRNVANTFTSFFTNTNTASRTYTLKDRNGTLIDDTDYNTLNTAISGKMANPSGTANFLSKFLTATTIGNSRIKDDGVCLGIDSVSPIALSKDIQLGRQGDKEIGIEQSDSMSSGKSLTISAGRTINFQETSSFIALNQTLNPYTLMAANSSGDVYVTGFSNGTVYKRTGGSGNFTSIASINQANAIACNLTTNTVYVAGYNADIYKQTGGSGSFVSMSAGVRAYMGLAVAPNNDVYVSVQGGDIYKQTGGTGSFVALGQTARSWYGMCAAPNGDIYAVVSGGDIYKQTGGTGNFNALSQTARLWKGLASDSSGNIYATVQNGDIYKQTLGAGNFVALGQTARLWSGITVDSSGNIYAAAADWYTNGDIYYQNNASTGTANLDGGMLKLKAGTGKGTGASRLQIVTGQKTASGTNMQTETVRAEFDENGNYKRIGTPVYADNTAALAGGLTVGMEYRTSTGVKMEVY